MKKNTQNESKNNENSTVFSDPKKAREENQGGKKIGKKIRNIVIALILVFVVLPWLIVTVAKWIKGPSGPIVPPFSSRVAATEADELAKDLFALKNKSVTDMEANQKIAEKLDIEYFCGSFTLTLQAEQKPYRLTMKFDDKPDDSRGEWFEETMVKYSCAFLMLVEDADQIGWEFPVEEEKDNGGYFTREDAKKLLGTDVALYGNSPEGVQLLLNELGLNE